MKHTLKLAQLALVLYIVSPASGWAQESGNLPTTEWFSFAANLDGGYRKTQFFDPNYDTAILQWDSRPELWLPPFRYTFSWGVYLRLSGVAGSKDDGWQNGLLASPGVGIQAYPFSLRRFRDHSWTGRILGPTRLFAEYNRQNYWGAANSWRPKEQQRVGMEYWKAANVNDLKSSWWSETWHGVYWQSANDFTSTYDTLVLANSGRLGIRKPGTSATSGFSPYLAVENSRTKNDDYYWENRLLLGAGLRFAPSLRASTENEPSFGLTRFVVYGEYLNTAKYYGLAAPSDMPRYEFRLGASASIGQWYR